MFFNRPIRAPKNGFRTKNSSFEQAGVEMCDLYKPQDIVKIYAKDMIAQKYSNAVMKVNTVLSDG